MDARLQRRVQRYGWDKAVEDYDAFWERQLEPAQRRLLEMADLRPGERVLDVACGSGQITAPAAERVEPEGKVVGVDISQKMIDRARERLGSGVRFERAGAEDLGEEESSFDAVLCSLGLMYVPDPLGAVREMHRVLRPGGRVAVSVWGRRDRCGWAEIFGIVDSRVRSQVCPMFFQQGTGDVLRGTLEGADFEDVAVERLRTTLHYDSPEEALGAAFAGGPVALAYSRFDEATRKEAHAEYLASIERYRVERPSSDRYEIPGEFVLATARRG